MFLELEIVTREDKVYPALFNHHSIIAIYPSLTDESRTIVALTNGKEYELNENFSMVKSRYEGKIK